MLKRSLKTLPVLFAAGLLLALPASSGAAGCPGARAMPSADNLGQVRTATLCLLNQERARRGMSRLRINRRLQIAAYRHSADMVRRSYFSHDAPGGLDMVHRILRVGGYISRSTSWELGENIAWGSGDYATASSIVYQWMHSAHHRANILNRRYHEIGIGVAAGAPAPTYGRAAATYTTDFGRR
jgi:uncharacterized protein YkwD